MLCTSTQPHNYIAMQYICWSGAFAHADDIRAITSSLSVLQLQIGKVVVENGLVLNPSKCEVLLVSSSEPTNSTSICSIDGQALVPKSHVKCCGFWWSRDLSAAKAIDEAIKKSKKGIFLPMEQWKPFKGI